MRVCAMKCTYGNDERYPLVDKMVKVGRNARVPFVCFHVKQSTDLTA